MRTPLALLLSLGLASSAVAAPMRIAVMEFQSGGATGGDLESLGKGLQSMITTDLAQVAAFQLVERSRLADIQAEIKLSRTALVDKSTAVKIGKLAGATHLVTGTYTVVGEQMRLDTRLFGVADGKILLAEKIEGEKDAFFELEKELVGKLIGAVGVKLAPKERAGVAKVHTADFEAFRKFSDGVELFDEKKYDEALVALRDASSRDASFTLATVTLAEYERVITELRTKADAIEAATAQMERLEVDKSIRDEMLMIEKLYGISRNSAAPPLERLTALHALALIYGYGDGYGHHEKLAKVQDEFALQRTADTLWRSYFAESSKVFPLVPLGISAEMSGDIPKPELFDKEFPEMVESLKDFRAGGFDHVKSLLYFDLNHVEELARRLGLDRRQELELRARVVEMGKKLAPDNEKYWRDAKLAMAKVMREIGEYGKSSALFGSLGAGEKEPYKLQELAREIEKNRELEKVVQQAPNKAFARELLTIMEGTWSDNVRDDARKRLLTMTRPAAWDLYVLSKARRFLKERDYVIVDDTPMWAVRASDEVLSTGPRTDPLRAKELRYHRNDRGRDAFIVVGGVPRKDVEARFEIVYTPADDWWPGQHQPEGGSTETPPRPVDPRRPDVAFAFGVRDVLADKRPLRSFQIVVAADAVRLCEVVQKDAYAPADVKVLAQEAVDLRGQKKVEVVAKIAGGNISVNVGGKSVTFKAPAERTGFYGVQFRGPGYAAVTKMKAGGGK